MSSSLSDSSYQEICRPLGVGMVSTEGEKLLNALRKIQTKLVQQKQQKSSDPRPTEDDNDFEDIANTSKAKTNSCHKCLVCCSCASGDEHIQCRSDRKSIKLVTTSGHQMTATSADNSNELIETRLKLIETQLQNISMQLMYNRVDTNGRHDMNGSHKTERPVVISQKRISSSKSSPSVKDNIEDEIRSEDKYETTINAIRAQMKTSDKMAKSKSMEAINRSHPSKHFHLQYKDIPFLLGTTSSKSHSVIANRQIEISRLKQHNQLCNDHIPTRKIFSQTIKNRVLDSEIKDLLYDLHEEHDYICEEIQQMFKQLETITDPNQRQDFNRELYFLSRRILAKKRQINELQELHSIIRSNAVDSPSETTNKPIVRQQINKTNNRNKHSNNNSVPKWLDRIEQTFK